ncbi:hypothetical protein BD410DRAFT_786798 [Rickenella mellea]|uniref:Smr domain-containing protein n=1 Tax=Rickenella mellea TaxID=50990 RepID=A0A4Y7QAI6_9AGAM|nr:hypothetical protein BD410DRAFT_786798 [Rickenella mellea]
MGNSDALAALQQTLQAEFCPPLDSSLIAALIAELPTDEDAISKVPLQNLRETLTMLAKQADLDENNLTDTFNAVHISPLSTTTDETSSMLDSPADTASSSVSSAPSVAHAFNSPLGFLQAAFPQLPSRKLQIAINDASANDADMESIVEGLLSDEYVRELEERGLEDDLSGARDLGEWTIANKKGKHHTNGIVTDATKDGKGRKKKGKVKAIPLADIRQQHHARPVPSGPRAARDPWVQLTSLATRLATLCPPHPASLFLSFFHSPNHATPAASLRAALVSISKKSSGGAPETDASPLFPLLDLLCSSPDYECLDSESRARLVSDAELALSVTDDRSDALDLIWLLRDLDLDPAFEIGVYHSPAPHIGSKSLPNSPSPRHASPIISPLQRTTIGGNSPTASARELPPTSPVKPRPPPAPHQNEWIFVQPRRPPPKGAHTHADFIPGYNLNNVPRKFRGSGNALGKGGKGDVGELDSGGNSSGSNRGAAGMSDTQRCKEYRRKRSEALRDASRFWQSGNAKTRGGEVAFYFAERAREYQEQSRRFALDAARERVLSKRMAGGDEDTVDLHGTTIKEAVVIVKEVLGESWCSPARPLTIITGRGSHSSNRVGVLGPAVKNVLDAEGWVVSKWDGGLVVRGKSSHQ